MTNPRASSTFEDLGLGFGNFLFLFSASFKSLLGSLIWTIRWFRRACSTSADASRSNGQQTDVF
jgi:hypothetical protein